MITVSIHGERSIVNTLLPVTPWEVLDNLLTDDALFFTGVGQVYSLSQPGVCGSRENGLEISFSFFLWRAFICPYCSTPMTTRLHDLLFLKARAVQSRTTVNPSWVIHDLLVPTCVIRHRLHVLTQGVNTNYLWRKHFGLFFYRVERTSIKGTRGRDTS